MSEERLTLVTDWATLKAGDIVVVRGCTECGGRHRQILLGRCTRDDHAGFGAFRIDPQPPCGGGPHGCLLTRLGVAWKVLYLVDTGLDRQETHEDAQGAPRHETACPDAVRRELATTGR